MTRNAKAPALKNQQDVAEFSGKIPRAFEKPPTPVTRVAGLTFWLFAVGIGFFGAMGYWAATAPMQSAVVATGSFEMEGDLQVVDHLEGGILSEINVVEGQDVEKGQILARLDGTRVKSQIGIVRSQLAAALARQARLEAMALGAEKITFPEELAELIAIEPSLAEVMATQEELFTSDLQSDQGQVQIFSERIAQLRTRLAGLDQEEATLNAQMVMVKDETQNLQDLFDQGLVTKTRLIARQEDLLELGGRLDQRNTQKLDALDQISEVQERQLQITRGRRAIIADQQQTLTENIFDLRQRIQSFEEVASRLEIKAPISGRIVGFEANTIGSVVAPGEMLMQIVPKDVPYVVEARVSTQDIDEVAVGRPARVRLSAYSFRKTPPIDGEVTYVSADSFLDEPSNVSYYQIHVKIAPDAFAKLPDVSPQAGMPVQVMVTTGEQTMLTYLLDPLLGGLETAMIESE